MMHVVIEKQILLTMTNRIHGGLSDKNFSQLGLNTFGKDKLQLSFKDRVMTIFCDGMSRNEKTGTVFVQAKLFSDMVRELPPGNITIISDTDTHLAVTAGKKGEFYMRLPLIENLQWQHESESAFHAGSIRIPSSKLSYMIDQVQFCINQDSPRNYGAVGFLHRPANNKLRLVGTDGFRLSFCEVEMPEETPLGNFLKDNGICISKRGLTELWRMSNEGFETVQLSVSEDMKTLLACVDGYKLYILLSTLNFPNYQGVIPDHKPTTLNVACQDLQGVLRRVLLASDKNRTLKMCLKKGNLTLSTRNQGNFEGQEIVSLENYEGPSGNLSVNGKFLADIISSTSSEFLDIRFNDDENPVLVIPVCEPKECYSKHVLVPIKDGG
jgi:DNA polymerase-3 subunit beta